MHWLAFFSGNKEIKPKNSKVKYKKPKNKTIIFTIFMITIIIVIIIVIIIIITLY